jgi:hypothetical protein
VRTTCIVVFLALSAAGAAGAADPPGLRTHVRPLTKGTATLLADAITRSAIVRGLVEDLGNTDVVVYLQEGNTKPREMHASLTFLTSAAGTRYLLVRIDCWREPPWELIAWLGHELQHAMEIALAPEVHDSASLARLYRRIGWPWGFDGFESDLARATGMRIRRELAGVRPRNDPGRFRGAR